MNTTQDDSRSIACPRCKSSYWLKHLEGQTKCIMCGRDLTEIINPPALVVNTGLRSFTNGMEAFKSWDDARD